jgi:Tfp pilus assembly protein PilF
VQDEIGQSISEALKVRLAPPTRTANIEAWQTYLKGRYHALRYTPESMAKAKEYFEQALAIDPNFAPAYASLASYFYTLGMLGMKPMWQVAPLSKSAGEKALAIDPANSDAHSVLATLAGFLDYDWKGAEIHHRQAMVAEPVPPMVRFRYALYYLLPLRRCDEAIEQNRLALETDPISAVMQIAEAYSLYNARRYQEAMQSAQLSIDIDPNFYMAWVVMAMAQIQAGEIEGSIAGLERVAKLVPWYSEAAWLLAVAYHLAGDREKEQGLVVRLAGSTKETSGAVTYYAATGDAEAMFESLEGAYGQRSLDIRVIPADPVFDRYRGDPRFRDLVRRMNLS